MNEIHDIEQRALQALRMKEWKEIEDWITDDDGNRINLGTKRIRSHVPPLMEQLARDVLRLIELLT